MNFIPKWNFKKADWDSFREYIDKQHNVDNNDINDFLNIIREAADINVPRTGQRPTYKHAPWWDDDCQKAVAKRKRAIRRCRTCPCIKHENELKIEIKACKETIKMQRKNGGKLSQTNSIVLHPYQRYGH